MANLKDIAVSRGTLLNMDPRIIKVKAGLNARDLLSPDNADHIDELAESIARDGVKVPLVIFSEGDDVFVVDGHCRLAATMLAIENGASILTVPCIPEARGVNNVDRALAQSVYNTGKRLSPLEQGECFKRAIALGASVKDIAAKVAKSVGYVNQMIDFQAAPAEVHTLVKNGTVSATFAAETVRDHGPVKGAAIVKQAVETAKAEGKSRATARHAPQDDGEDDPRWAKLRAFMIRNAKRPKGVIEEDIEIVEKHLGRY